MINECKVSIIIPVHNAASTIERCVQSIVEQSYKNLECILVENGSSDCSLKICREYEKIYKVIKVITCEHKGVSAARNLGLLAATGDVIGFCDADDFIERDAIRNVVSEFVKNDDIIGVFGAFFVGNDSDEGIVKNYKGKKKKVISSREAIELVIGDDDVMGALWNKYYKAEMIKDIYFDTELSYCEDMHFNTKLLSRTCKNEKVMLIDIPLYCYMMNSQSVTHNSKMFFDSNNNLKYIVAMHKIMDDCNMENSDLSVVRMKIAKFAIDYAYRDSITMEQLKKLMFEIMTNWRYLFLNLCKFHFKSNIRTIIKGIIVLVRYVNKRVVSFCKI